MSNPLQSWLEGQGLSEKYAHEWQLALLLSLLSFAAYWYCARPLPAGLRALRERRSSPIAYKQAWLWNPHSHEPFMGVAGEVPYGADEDRRNHHGFHSFYTLSLAQVHVQEGNVLLEVYNSGRVERRQLGTIADHQRVLQVLIGPCFECEEQQATRWVESTDGLRNAGTYDRFVCGDCGELYGNGKTLTELESTLRRSTGVELVVATLEATGDRGKFRPTEVKGDS